MGGWLQPLEMEGMAMAQAKQWWLLVRLKDEPGSNCCRAYVTASNAYEAIQVVRALYGKLLFSQRAVPVWVKRGGRLSCGMSVSVFLHGNRRIYARQ